MNNLLDKIPIGFSHYELNLNWLPWILKLLYVKQMMQLLNTNETYKRTALNIKKYEKEM